MQSLDAFTVALLAPDRAFARVDSSSRIGESDGACDTIEDGRHRLQNQPQVQGDGQALVVQRCPRDYLAHKRGHFYNDGRSHFLLPS